MAKTITLSPASGAEDARNLQLRGSLQVSDAVNVEINRTNIKGE